MVIIPSYIQNNAHMYPIKPNTKHDSCCYPQSLYMIRTHKGSEVMSYALPGDQYELIMTLPYC